MDLSDDEKWVIVRNNIKAMANVIEDNRGNWSKNKYTTVLDRTADLIRNMDYSHWGFGND